MIGPALLRDLLIVAAFELREMLRTRRILIVLALYLLGGLVAAYGFVEFLRAVEEAAANALGTAATARPGALTEQLLKEPMYQSAFRTFFRNNDEADFLIKFPPMALFFAWSSFSFVPILIVITATDTVAQETMSRGYRFINFRTGRLEYVLGKATGQLLLLAALTLSTAFVYMLVAFFGLYNFELGSNLSGMLFFWPRILAYCAPFLALAVSVSAMATSTNVARAASIIALLSFTVLNAVLRHYSRLDPSWWMDLLRFLMPLMHRDALWGPDWLEVMGVIFTLLSLGGLYLAVGIAVFARRDI